MAICLSNALLSPPVWAFVQYVWTAKCAHIIHIQSFNSGCTYTAVLPTLPTLEKLAALIRIHFGWLYIVVWVQTVISMPWSNHPSYCLVNKCTGVKCMCLSWLLLLCVPVTMQHTTDERKVNPNYSKLGVHCMHRKRCQPPNQRRKKDTEGGGGRGGGVSGITR